MIKDSCLYYNGIGIKEHYASSPTPYACYKYRGKILCYYSMTALTGEYTLTLRTDKDYSKCKQYNYLTKEETIKLRDAWLKGISNLINRRVEINGEIIEPYNI